MPGLPVLIALYLLLPFSLTGLSVLLVTQKHKALSWVVLNCSVPVNFFKWRGGGVHVDYSRGHPDVVPAVALLLTCSHVELFCNVLSHFDGTPL